jgi:hypothetical protein
METRGAAMKAFGAGLFYAGGVFALAFFTGVVRTILLAHDDGLTPAMAVLFELPVILIAAWVICGYVVRRVGVARDVQARAIMGGVAFVAILAAECALSAAITGGGIAAFVASYARLETLLGLGGQIVCAFFPLMRR